MRVILTHEQADFDALASLIGAHLLDEYAIPVLPRRLNRNVRAFVTLYGAEFPFAEPKDIPPGPITGATLVDTQSLVTLKGMSDDTRVAVVDHHPLRPGLPDDWQVSISETGSTTTVLVEDLQRQDIHISAIAATLLLLGIYEDTGSLTYAHTSVRDVRAAAYLLDQGASLQIAVEFLNPPLSPDQRRVYEQLIANAQTHHINGHRIMIACADARSMDEEISSLAHKIRDLLDPDALFVIVQTSDGVRIVARSTTDNVDVGAIASRFGGGGHDRAAAALIRSESASPHEFATKSVCDRLLAILPEHVLPSITVAQIMSRSPRLLSGDTSVSVAANLMQRTGFEGYPVVENGIVVGLLTRRAVDRAQAHRLNLPASSLMDAGSITVNPTDSIQHLQNVMVASGWGQIPVVDPASGRVIGIVTRTDLIKTLTPQPAHPKTANLAARLTTALSAQRLELIRTVAAQAVELNQAVYIVGGFVRDLILDRPSLDFDIVVEGDAIQLAKALVRAHAGRLTSHSRFNTAKWFLSGSRFDSPDLPEFLDLISARTEFYEHPTALPTVSQGGIKLDLHRRDFTINTLAIRLDGRHFGELHDNWGGLGDLERGLVRVLHSLSFVDDPTRMLRAVRFEQRFGFQIETRTRQLMDEAFPLLEKLSGDRIRHELDLIFDESAAPAMLNRLGGLGIFKVIHPALPWTSGLHTAIQTGLAAPAPSAFDLAINRRFLGYLLWCITLSHAEIDSLSIRLHLPVTLVKMLHQEIHLWQILPSLTNSKPSQWVVVLDEVHPLAVYAVWLSAPQESVRHAILAYMDSWRHIQPVATGHTLRQRGLPPGPRYQKILTSLRAAWLDGEISSPEAETQLLDRLVSDFS